MSPRTAPTPAPRPPHPVRARSRVWRLPAAAAAVAVLALVGTACGGGHTDHGATATETADIPVDAGFNAADVAFAQGMIVHHGQAVQMASLAATNSTNPEVLELAAEIRANQQPEIDQMTAWLETWRQPVPDVMMDHTTMDHEMMDHEMMGHGDMPMDGMIDQARLDEMAAARGDAFDALFLAAMIEHHRGAISMARYVIDNGKYPPVSVLAEAIIAAQQAEIVEMEKLAGQ